MKGRQRCRGIIWIALYLVLALAPLIFMLVGERPMGREFVRELSVALGFAGIGLMALHFVMTARIKALKAPFGSDVVYFFHHRMGIVTLAFWLAHPIILFIRFEWSRALLNIFTAPWRAKFGVASVVVILILVVISVWRKKLKIEYTKWRIWHGALAVLAMAAVMTHAYMVGRYVGTPAKRAIWLSYGTICVLAVAYLRVYKPWQMLRRPFRVAEILPERGAVWSLLLEPEGHAGIRFRAGQFAWLTAFRSPFSMHEHPFSFATSADDDSGRVGFAIKELGDFTATIGQLKPGDRVYIDGPYGVFCPDCHTDVDNLLLIAGGVGIATMISILRTMADRDDQRPVTLLYGNPDWDSIAYREELAELETKLNLKVVHVLERPPEGWEGQTGYVTREVIARYLPEERPASLRAFVCGPTGMLNLCEGALRELDVPERFIHLERFDLA